MSRPDDDVIASQAESGFFVQLAVEAGHEVHVSVTPLANRVYRWEVLSKVPSQKLLFKNFNISFKVF